LTRHGSTAWGAGNAFIENYGLPSMRFIDEFRDGKLPDWSGRRDPAGGT
jgi:hypothetical protein